MHPKGSISCLSIGLLWVHYNLFSVVLCSSVELQWHGSECIKETSSAFRLLTRCKHMFDKPDCLHDF